jgi:(p)ppGpp synthase/HD superfamily hydrolase
MIDVFGAHYVFDASEESLEFIRQGCHDLEMTWDHGPRWLTARRFVARRRIVGSAPNGIGILHELSDALANCDVNVVTVAARETHQSNENRFVFDLNVEVHDVDRLLSKLTELETIPGWIIRSAEIDA